MRDEQGSGTVLAVDLDGTLIRTDMLYEGFWAAFAASWRAPFQALAALTNGKAALKERLAALAEIDVTRLPYDQQVLDRLHLARAEGAQIVLITAADQRHAQAVADHLGLFDAVHASDGQTNLSGAAKLDQLRTTYGGAKVIYVGDSRQDLPVWQGTAGAITVGAPARLRAQVDALCPGAEHLSPAPGAARQARAALRAMRPHQWMKNALVFVPMLAAHDHAGLTFMQAALAFVAFSLVASAVYLLNDLLDLSADRAHPRKCTRPLASGALPIRRGMVMVPGLLLPGLALAVLLGPLFLLVMGGYFALTLAYSLRLKRKVLVDICVLASLYALRIVAGAVATGIVLSVWLLAFSLFLFLALAAVKRQAELVDMAGRGADKTEGRGYRATDLPVITQIATASGFVSVLVLMLYLTDPGMREQGYSPLLIGTACLLLIYWLSRMILLAHRGEMDDDPMVFSLRDPVSLVSLMLFTGLFLGATQP
ncbi:MAG: UbiA family prenyltransferase [Pararhodobacter sp.]